MEWCGEAEGQASASSRQTTEAPQPGMRDRQSMQREGCRIVRIMSIVPLVSRARRICFGVFALVLVPAGCVAQARNVVLVMTDGLRWQELVRGADAALLTPERYYGDRSVDALKKSFLAPTAEQRRKLLMPFVWGTLVPHGTLFGDRDAGSDAAPPGTYSCGGTAVSSCVGCAGAPVECPTTSTCVANCGLCNLTTLFECDACYADGGLAVQRCEAQTGTAFAECLSGFNRCPCTTESNCPGGNQTCESGECFECGEPDAGAQDGEKCKAGPMAAKCHATAGATFGTCF